MLGEPNPDCVIESAKAKDLEVLLAIEARATERFDADTLPPDLPLRMLPDEDLDEAQAEGRVFVARSSDGRVMGFVLVEVLEGVALVEELDVDPADGRRGVGTRLVEAACDWARDQGFSRIVLSTFRDVPWNAPFYTRLGFTEIPIAERTRALDQIAESEVRLGFDPAERVLMARSLDRP